MARLLHARRPRLAIAVAIGVALLLCSSTARPAAHVQPSDPGWRDDWAARQVHLPDAWEVTTGNGRVVVATVDTGVQPVAVPRDTFGHGTAVASAIAARSNNGVGTAGACWSCLVMPIRVAAGDEAKPELIAQGIRWAVDHGARVVNVSLAASEPDPGVEAAVAYARAHDVLVVASAGNNGTEQPSYPAALPGVLAVAGTNRDDRLFDWSSRGGWVSLAAPGCEPVDARPSGWGILCGSSVAPALVSGIVGLVLSIDPSLSAARVAAALEASAVPVEGIGGGRVDAYAALAELGLAPRQPASRYQPAILTESGLLAGRLDRQVDVGAGTFRLELATADAGRCAATVLAGGAAVTASGSSAAHSLVLETTVAEQTVRVAVACPGQTGRPYSLTIVARLPRS